MIIIHDVNGKAICAVHEHFRTEFRVGRKLVLTLQMLDDDEFTELPIPVVGKHEIYCINDVPGFGTDVHCKPVIHE